MTIEREGRARNVVVSRIDEVLEAAIRHILGPAADEQAIRRMAAR